MDGLTALLTDDVTLVSDSGGKARAPLRVLSGADKVGRFLTALTQPRNTERFLRSAGLEEDATERLWVGVGEVNGGPAVIISVEGRTAAMVVLDVVDDRVRHVYLLVNPDKMSRLRAPEPS